MFISYGISTNREDRVWLPVSAADYILMMS